MRMNAAVFAMMIPVSITAVALAAGDGNAADQTNAQEMPLETMAQMRMPRPGGGGDEGADQPDFPKFDDVSKDYKKVISTTDGQNLYTLYKRDKDAQMLAELPANFESQRLFIAVTIASGIPTAGVQWGDMHVQWKRFDKTLALIEPNLAVRTTGDLESRKGHDRVFTDRVILEVPIVCMGPGGGPVIDMDGLLLGQAGNFFGRVAAGINPRLAKIERAKAFPQNVEIAFELPLQGGRIGTLHYSISVIPENTGYQTRQADNRVGYFVTTYRDIGDASDEEPWKRFVNRWKLEKADPKLSLSPPKEPIIFYLEHTVPVRYRRWVRDGVLEWNKAFEKVGIINAIEVYQQDARTGAHMEKDPEDVRYNFVMWTNANMGFAIGPSRVDPRTGQILDADIVMDEGFINSWVRAWQKFMPEIAMEGFTPQTLSWLEKNPDWDPRVRLAATHERDDVIRQIQHNRIMRGANGMGGHEAANADFTLLGDDRYDGLADRVSQLNGACMNAQARAMDVALFRLDPALFAEIAREHALVADDEAGDDEGDDADTDEGEGDKDDEDKGDKPPKKPEGDMLDGVPDWFIGPMLKDVVMHEVGHTLGLRHNFKASSIHTCAHVNTEEMKGQPITGSVMDYNPININFEDGPVQGEYTMVTIGPYDYWAIEYGYTAEKDLKPILARVSEHELPYATDEDTWGPDPLARRFDFGADSLEYAESTLRLTHHLRGQILDRLVKEGQTWAKAREAYQILLNRQLSAVSIAANWIGGAYVNRDHKGDPGDRNPIEAVETEKQRRALRLVIENTFYEDAYGLTPELLAKMTVDKWWDGGGSSIYDDPTWPVHERILAIQAVAMTMLLNPTTLNRVYDNEFRVSADEDAITVPEIISSVADAAWGELDQTNGGKYTARKPMISSLRRNLQREHLERMIDLMMSNDGFGAAAKPVANLTVYKLRELLGKIEKVTGKGADRIDPYTLAHLSEAKVRIEKALDADYIYNLDSLDINLGMPMFFGQPNAESYSQQP
jgi:hypothetical protein